MKWELSDRVELKSDHISPRDAARQSRTAKEILARLSTEPGQILADEVGMGKTFVALAVAVSVVESTGGQVVVMVPPSVSGKWPLEWQKFAAALGPGSEIRATEETVRSGSTFLKLLDDPVGERKQLIFLTHGALSSNLNDGYVKLAILQRALRPKSLDLQRAVFPRWAATIIGGLDRRLGEKGIAELVASSPTTWRKKISIATGVDPGDDPVPAAVLSVLKTANLGPLRGTLRHRLPLRHSGTIATRLGQVRQALSPQLSEIWRESLRQLELDLPLLILDEAHHTKNRGTRLASLFANETGPDDAKLMTGELGGTFRRMLFLTATPFQLGHDELIEVLSRFEGIRWDDLDREQYCRQLDRLKSSLDASQEAALRLEYSWGRLATADTPDDPAVEWWKEPQDPSLSPAANAAATHWVQARNAARTSQKLLRPHVIRHTRIDRDSRRDVLTGAALVPGVSRGERGLEIASGAVLPFLLAARARSVVAMNGLRDHNATRAVFADGLASSFEAYRHTRSGAIAAGDIDEAQQVLENELPEETAWYLDRISEALPDSDIDAFAAHPKVRATVDRAVDLWRRREKCLIFCFYVATGRALRLHVAKAIQREIQILGAEKLGLDVDDEDGVERALDRFQARLFTPDSPSRRYAEDEIAKALSGSMSGKDLDRATGLCLRFLRTQSFLVRYVDLSLSPLEALENAFETRDESGRAFREVVGSFGGFLASRQPLERERFLAALERIEVGHTTLTGDDDVRESLIAAVRLANGDVARDDRERLMVGFNTPFYPEVLIASSVMAEGVDLHLMCRNVIHHDLDWNPSTIEQRTGRLDRIGSKGEQTGKPVIVYEPFIEGAQDEKQFRVMRDRERWFNVVMGERLELDEWSTEQIVDRVEFPRAAAEELAMDLSVVRGSRSKAARG